MTDIYIGKCLSKCRLPSGRKYAAYCIVMARGVGDCQVARLARRRAGCNDNPPPSHFQRRITSGRCTAEPAYIDIIDNEMLQCGICQVMIEHYPSTTIDPNATTDDVDASNLDPAKIVDENAVASPGIDRRLADAVG